MKKTVLQKILNILVGFVFFALLAVAMPQNTLAVDCYSTCINGGSSAVVCTRQCSQSTDTNYSGGSGGLNDVFGNVEAPPGVSQFASGLEGLPAFMNVILKVLLIGAGIYSVFNLVLAGYAFLSAGDDPKKVEGAWKKIWQTILGLTIAAGAFVIAAIIGQVLFGDYNALLQFRIFGPGQ